MRLLAKWPVIVRKHANTCTKYLAYTCIHFPNWPYFLAFQIKFMLFSRLGVAYKQKKTHNLPILTYFMLSSPLVEAAVNMSCVSPGGLCTNVCIFWLCSAVSLRSCLKWECAWSVTLCEKKWNELIQTFNITLFSQKTHIFATPLFVVYLYRKDQEKVLF